MFKFKTKRGRLTAYAFGCGYIEQKTTDSTKFCEEDLYTELFHLHGVFQVRQVDRRPGAKIFRVFWDSYKNLSEARKRFDEQPGQLVVSTANGICVTK